MTLQPVATQPDLDRVLDVEHLSVSFGTTRVLNDLTFSVEPGSSLAIIGPNGAGKTVLLRALLGSVAYEGVVRWSPGTRLGYVPQKLDLDRDIPLTGEDFLSSRLGLLPRGKAGRRDSGASMAETFELVGLGADVARKPIGTVSGGQFQRLLIAFALIGQPDVLLLDEPTAGVDEPGQEQINGLLARLQREHKMTILFISHDLSVVFEFAEQVLCLSRKRPYIGQPRQILTPDLLEEIYGMPLRYHVHDA